MVNQAMVSFEDIKNAYVRIGSAVNRTPVMTSRTLNERTGAEIYLKCENFQRIGAFKFRGAYNALSKLSEEQRKKGVITHSSGNHAQAVALAGKLLGIKTVIVMPDVSPQVKVNATKGYGAEVVFCTADVKSRAETTNKLIEKHGFTMVHPYDNDDVIEGQGTACLELLQDHPDIEIVIAPVGGGGLLSGTSIAAKGFNPEIIIYAAEPEKVNDAFRSFKTGSIQTNEIAKSIADGLLTNLSERTFAYIKKNVQDIITVSESEIIDAMQFLWERMKIIAEPSGAVSVAAILSGKIDLKGKKVGAIISGGNVDIESFFTDLRKKIN